jgi:hypothetical protein
MFLQATKLAIKNSSFVLLDTLLHFAAQSELPELLAESMMHDPDLVSFLGVKYPRTPSKILEAMRAISEPIDRIACHLQTGSRSQKRRPYYLAEPQYQVLLCLDNPQIQAWRQVNEVAQKRMSRASKSTNSGKLDIEKDPLHQEILSSAQRGETEILQKLLQSLPEQSKQSVFVQQVLLEALQDAEENNAAPVVHTLLDFACSSQLHEPLAQAVIHDPTLIRFLGMNLPRDTHIPLSQAMRTIATAVYRMTNGADISPSYQEPGPHYLVDHVYDYLLCMNKDQIQAWREVHEASESVSHS